MKLFRWRKTAKESEEKKTGSSSAESGRHIPADEKTLTPEIEMEAASELEKAKTEYQMVIGYVTDIQEIENLPEAEKRHLAELAKRLVRLSSERKKYQSGSENLSDSQMLFIEKHEPEIPGILRELQSAEKKQLQIKRDMQQLEGEKGVLSGRLKELLSKIRDIKAIAITAFAAMVVIILILAAMQLMAGFDTRIGILAAILGASLTAAWTLVRMRQNQLELAKTEINMNRAIEFLNKAKLQYVNATNGIEYIYEKYSINSSRELEYLWEQYRRAAGSREKYRQNAKELDSCCDELTAAIGRFRINDPEIWVYQAEALADENEMEALKGRLMERIGKLREKLDTR
ncbi:AAA family ATPase [Anaerobium acetethylicum]|uniref:Uncharacterized protein n=1 Tax=Anaerobium acetethylicum TaxID=1619234 RepID=A0A1D3TXH3_9FIRM|nr:hypothetical protein [Anaerobium acetethylicum]SCP99021.1 hypothetical protein SAMN05421730_10312 [Anaerobium acetethylicum]